MKRKLLMILSGIFLLSASGYSQIQKGNVLAGGDIANFNIGLKSGSAFQMTIDPKLAFFIKDNLAVGAYLNFGLTSVAHATSTSYGVGGLARYYFNDKKEMNPLRHSRIFVEGNVGINGQNVSGGSSTNGLGLGIGPGYAYFITPNIGLETLLKYNGIVGFGNSVTQSNLNLNVGFQIYLPSRKLKSNLENDAR